jgi:hypothetical protein
VKKAWDLQWTLFSTCAAVMLILAVMAASAVAVEEGTIQFFKTLRRRAEGVAGRTYIYGHVGRHKYKEYFALLEPMGGRLLARRTASPNAGPAISVPTLAPASAKVKGSSWRIPRCGGFSPGQERLVPTRRHPG